jgi:type III secretion protein R
MVLGTMRRLSLAVMAGLPVLLVHSTAFAQKSMKDILGGSDLSDAGVANRPVMLMVALAGLALVPFLLIMVTSFVKIAVVLSIVRQAVGTQQIPPTQVITGLAMILTIYIMMPVGLEIYHDTEDMILKSGGKKPLAAGTTSREEVLIDISKFSVDQMIEVAKNSQHPIRAFLIKHAHLKDRDMFYKLAWKMREPRDRATLTDEDFAIIVPAFVISELKEAFQIGFILFVPFLVIDMVVSNILMALGMQMLSPTTISLPFKILLFVLVDGWYLITRGLVLGYS